MAGRIELRVVTQRTVETDIIMRITIVKWQEVFYAMHARKLYSVLLYVEVVAFTSHISPDYPSQRALSTR